MRVLMTNYLDVLASPRRPKIAVVLSSGGIKTCAAIELFVLLEKAQIPIDLLVGCSGGAIAAVGKAMGLEIAEMRHTVENMAKPETFTLDYRTLRALMRLPFSSFETEMGILKGAQLQKNMLEMVGDRRIEDLPIKTILQVTSMETGRGVAMSTGNLAKTLYASSAIIPFLPPIQIEGRWYVDGCYSVPLPILEAVLAGVDIIIAMDFQSGVASSTSTSYLEYFYNFNMDRLRNTVRLQNAFAVDTHHYEIVFIDVNFKEDIAMWNNAAIPYIYEQGKIAAERAKEGIIQAIELFPLTHHIKMDT